MIVINLHDSHRAMGDSFKTRDVENVLFFVIFVKFTKDT